MSLKNRVLKIEQDLKPVSTVLIAVDGGETNEAALERHLADGGARPTTVIYVSPVDLRL